MSVVLPRLNSPITATYRPLRRACRLLLGKLPLRNRQQFQRCERPEPRFEGGSGGVRVSHTSQRQFRAIPDGEGSTTTHASPTSDAAGRAHQARTAIDGGTHHRVALRGDLRITPAAAHAGPAARVHSDPAMRPA